MVILDTDHLTVIQRHSQPTFSLLSARLARVPPGEVFTTIVNVEEQMRLVGRYWTLEEGSTRDRGLSSNSPLLSFFAEIPVLNFDEPAAERFMQLRRSRIRLGSMDLKIAAIALSQEASYSFPVVVHITRLRKIVRCIPMARRTRLQRLG